MGVWRAVVRAGVITAGVYGGGWRGSSTHGSQDLQRHTVSAPPPTNKKLCTSKASPAPNRSEGRRCPAASREDPDRTRRARIRETPASPRLPFACHPTTPAPAPSCSSPALCSHLLCAGRRCLRAAPLAHAPSRLGVTGPLKADELLGTARLLRRAFAAKWSEADRTNCAGVENQILATAAICPSLPDRFRAAPHHQPNSPGGD